MVDDYDRDTPQALGSRGRIKSCAFDVRSVQADDRLVIEIGPLRIRKDKLAAGEKGEGLRQGTLIHDATFLAELAEEKGKRDFASHRVGVGPDV